MSKTGIQDNETVYFSHRADGTPVRVREWYDDRGHLHRYTKRIKDTEFGAKAVRYHTRQLIALSRKLSRIARLDSYTEDQIESSEYLSTVDGIAKMIDALQIVTKDL